MGISTSAGEGVGMEGGDGREVHKSCPSPATEEGGRGGTGCRPQMPPGGHS